MLLWKILFEEFFLERAKKIGITHGVSCAMQGKEAEKIQP